jgi:hypothetical protein
MLKLPLVLVKVGPSALINALGHCDLVRSFVTKLPLWRSLKYVEVDKERIEFSTELKQQFSAVNFFEKTLSRVSVGTIYSPT